jgi:hypothetical protein
LYPQVVRIQVTASGFDKLGFDIYYLLEVETEQGWIAAGKVKTGMICYDYNSKTKVPVPTEAVVKMTSHLTL